MESSVTVGKQRSRALAYRPGFHSSSAHSNPTNDSSPMEVTITKTEHEYFLRATKEYHTLRDNLLKSGITSEVLSHLTSENVKNGDRSRLLPDNWRDKMNKLNINTNFATSPHKKSTSESVPNKGISPNPQSFKTNGLGLTKTAMDSTTGKYSLGTLRGINQQPSTLQQELRTVIISKLPVGTTFRELVNVIRGGRLLEIQFRFDHSATVTFMEGAKEFVSYADTHGVYIDKRKVEVGWNDRQFAPLGVVISKMAIGATRNLLIRGAAGKITAKCIRNDLEHIHNLVVIDIMFQKGNAYVSTNSVKNALFARTCMLSRFKYKGLKFDWYPDECACSLPSGLGSRRPTITQTSESVPDTPISNRFSLLGTEESEYTSEDDFTHVGAPRSRGVLLSNWGTDTEMI